MQFACRDRNRLGAAGRPAGRGRARRPQRRVHDRRRRERRRPSRGEADLRHRLDPPDPHREDHAGRGDVPVRPARSREPPSFLIGAVENPFAPPLEFRPMRLGKKIEAGAEFVQTQICFNLETAAAVHGAVRRARAARPRVGAGRGVRPALGDGPPVPARPGARHRRARGRHRADGRRRRASARGRRASGSRSRSSSRSAQIPGVSGIHLMSINNEEAIPRVVEEAGLLPATARASAEPARLTRSVLSGSSQASRKNVWAPACRMPP